MQKDIDGKEYTTVPGAANISVGQILIFCLYSENQLPQDSKTKVM